MCGIAGYFNRNEYGTAQPEQVARMLSRIQHRGPDDHGLCGIDERWSLWTASGTDAVAGRSGRGVLGFNRLSIRDVSAMGHQPMLSEQKDVVITFDGEIFNAAELKALLRGKYRFRGTADAEVLLYLFLEYGFERMIQMLNGMFAIVLFDIRKKKLYMARDRFGIIPLHLMITKSSIYWASEIKCFLEVPDFKREVSSIGLQSSFMGLYYNESIHREIERFEPGTMLVWDMDRDDIEVSPFFDINEYGREKLDCGNMNEVENLLRDCVERQLTGDVNAGVQFSGGVDSTLLAVYASEFLKKQGKCLPAYSLIYSDQPQYSEEPWMDLAASRLGINVTKADMGVSKFVENFERSIYAYERFLNLPSPIGICEFSKTASGDVKVLLTGEGADEVCGGYREFGIWKNELQRRKTASETQEEPDLGTDEFLLPMFLSQENIKKLLGCYDADSMLQERRTMWESLEGSSFDKARKFYFKISMISMLERQNKICMANSVECRAPFLDNEFVKYMFAVPENRLLHLNQKSFLKSKPETDGCMYEGKWLLKQLSEKYFGKEFAYRKKQAMRMPLLTYLQTPLFRNYLDIVILPGMRKRGLIDMNIWGNAYRDLANGENLMMVWSAINCEAWHQLFVDGRMPMGEDILCDGL